jgi:undecaprenyl-diphosphatase
LATLTSAVLAVVIGRLLADYLPFRSRPLQSPELGFVLPYGVSIDSLRNWSSFPSDHAMVFFAMSTGLWYVSRALGAGSTIYVACVIALPRIYMGYHYPTDIICGGLLGALFAYLANLERVRRVLTAPAMKWQDVHPASFYTCFFLFSQGLATLFDPVRNLAVLLRSLMV